MKRLVILGATGSIGKQALDVVSRAGDEFELVGLSANSAVDELLGLAVEHGVERVALSDPVAAQAACGAGRVGLSDPGSAKHASAVFSGEVLSGSEGVAQLIAESDADLVLNAIVGSAGLGPTVVALSEGIDVALANKESLVVGGELVMALAAATDAKLLPVDSEHAALHQLIDAVPTGSIDRVTLTASGGPFRGYTSAQLAGVSVAQALAHPTWAMGGKITIDSATLMNKGLELIEAHHLFGLAVDQIDVVVHPQSIIHATVSVCDGSTLAHLGYPDMRVPIAYALHYPDRVDVPVESLDLVKLGQMTFEAPDEQTFRCLALARAAARVGGTAPCVLNAANEVAVHAFLAGRLRFDAIAAVVETVLERSITVAVHSFETLFAADAQARREASELIGMRMAA